MKEHVRADYRKPGKSEESEKKSRAKQKASSPSFDVLHSWSTDPSLVTGTPFIPRLQEHAEILSRIPLSAQRHEFIMRLHRTYGSRYVQRLMESVNVQAKLSVSDPNDVYEQEAERVSGEVLKSINTPIKKQSVEEEEELAMAEAAGLQRQADEEEEELAMAEATAVRRQADEEEEELAMSRPASEVKRQAAEEEEEEVQMQSDEGQLQAVSEDLETRINNARGGGQPLAGDIRTSMEGAFGTDFGGVKLHTDSEADELNRQLSARAFTTGKDVFFRQGEYSPTSDSGRKLIAHELTHVIQQTGEVAASEKAADQSYRGIPSYLREQLTHGQPDVERYREALQAFRQEHDDTVLDTAFSGLCERPDIERTGRISPLQRIRIQCRGERADPYFNLANLHFITTGRATPTLYFTGPAGKGRLRQVHPKGPKIQQPDDRERRFFIGNTYKQPRRDWANYKRTGTDAAWDQFESSFMAGSAVPVHGSTLLEYSTALGFHPSTPGTVSTDLAGYTDKSILQIKQAIEGV
jgi:hypothetical protein